MKKLLGGLKKCARTSMHFLRKFKCISALAVVSKIAFCKISYFSFATLLCKAVGTGGQRSVREGGTVFWMGFYADISKESRWSNEIKVWGHLCHILVILKSLLNPEWKGCLEIARTIKIWQRILKFSFFFRVYTLI